MPSIHGPEFLLRLLAPVLWALAILWLSLTPSPPQVTGVLGWDKLLHAGAFCLLTFLFLQLLTSRAPRSGKTWWLAASLSLAYGALIEILQLLVGTGRTAEWGDLIADGVGTLLGCVVFRQASLLCCLHHDKAGRSDG